MTRVPDRAGPGGMETGATADWTEGTPAVLVRRCRNWGHRWYLRRTFYPVCASPEIGASRAAGEGTVVAVTVVRRRPRWAEPVGISLVDLDEGVRVMGRCPLTVTVGLRVTLGFDEDEDQGTRVLAPSYG